MVVKMAKWSPWLPALPPATRKFQVKLTSFRLEGIENIFEWKTHGNGLALKVKWKGEPRRFGLHHLVSKQHYREDLTRVKMLGEGQGGVTWDDEFENTCCFTEVSGHGRRQFGPWRISFHVLLGKSDAKLVAVGKGSVNVSEVAARMVSDIQWEIPVSLRAVGDASLLVNFTITEVRDSLVLVRNGSNLIESVNQVSVKLDEPGTSLVMRSNSSWTELDRDKKAAGWFSWKRPRTSVRPIQSKDEPSIKKTRSWNFGSMADSVFPNSNQDKIGEYSETSVNSNGEVDETIGAWEPKELISRDGETKLKSDVFLATFDQRSDKAAGESACTALVAVISHWLHSNADATPTRPEFDDLIVQGSSEWRNLCDNASYLKSFPNKHFDLETVLHAGVRPVAVSREKSFVGFFNPEKFESLTGVMSFDEIWQKIVAFNDDQPRVYIISWNDHFFVLKIDSDAYYIIDTLGERLFEGCEKAFILRFDNSSLMLQKGNSDGDEKVISSGKECCREFIVRFLAAIPMEELEEEEKKGAVSYFSLHQRLQIEFNLTCLLSSPSSRFSSLSSSPFSSSAVSTPSRL